MPPRKENRKPGEEREERRQSGTRYKKEVVQKGGPRGRPNYKSEGQAGQNAEGGALL